MQAIWPVTVRIGAALVVLVTGGISIAQSPQPQANGAARAPGAASGAASNAAARIERGRYLADAGNCGSCHTRAGGAPFSGGLAFTTKLGTIYSSNITPDVQSGIGRWTLEDFRRAMHEGIAPGGRHLFPAFPYTAFTRVSDADVAAIYAYLRTLPPARYTPPVNSFLLRQRWGMVFWNLMFFRPGRFRPDPNQSAEWNRGAYLVGGLGHCDVCHSPRNVFMAERAGRAYAGGTFLDEVSAGRIRAWSAVNLTASMSGLAAWSVDDLARYLQSGVCPRAGVFGPMNAVIDNSLRHLSPQDTHAMAVYLKGLPPRDSGEAVVADAAVKAGARLYGEHCRECHMGSGRGGLFSAPPLAGSAVVQAPDPASLINIILYGPSVPKDISLGGWQTMMPYKGDLSDAQIAAVSSYVRGSWKNRASEVTAAEVAAQR